MEEPDHPGSQCPARLWVEERRSRYNKEVIPTLQEIAKERGLDGVSRLRKHDLVQRLLDTDAMWGHRQSLRDPWIRARVEQWIAP